MSDSSGTVVSARNGGDAERGTQAMLVGRLSHCKSVLLVLALWSCSPVKHGREESQPGAASLREAHSLLRTGLASARAPPRPAHTAVTIRIRRDGETTKRH